MLACYCVALLLCYHCDIFSHLLRVFEVIFNGYTCFNVPLYALLDFVVTAAVC